MQGQDRLVQGGKWDNEEKGGGGLVHLRLGVKDKGGGYLPSL